jgi:hypothetical protein
VKRLEKEYPEHAMPDKPIYNHAIFHMKGN